MHQIKKSLSIYTENPVIKKGIRFYKEILMSQVSKSGINKSNSFIDNSIMKFTSPPRETSLKMEDSKLDDRRSERVKFSVGPNLFPREIIHDRSIESISDIKATPEPKRDYSRKTLDIPNSTPIAGSARPITNLQPFSKEKKVKKVKKVKKQSRSRSPNDAKKIHSSVTNKNIN